MKPIDRIMHYLFQGVMTRQVPSMTVRSISLLIMFLVAPQYIQAQTLEEKLVEITCNCVVEAQAAKGKTSDRVLLDNCFSKYTEDYKSEFLARMEAEGSTLEYVDFAFKIMMDIQHNLVQKCDLYYLLIDKEMSLAFTDLTARVTDQSMAEIEAIIE